VTVQQIVSFSQDWTQAGIPLSNATFPALVPFELLEMRYIISICPEHIGRLPSGISISLVY